MYLLQLESVSAIELSTIERLFENFIDRGTHFGYTLIKAILIFIIGRFVITLLNKLVKKILQRRHLNNSVTTFLGSLVNVVLTVLLIISVIGALGIQTTSFAAILASAGVAIGVAMSGNLSNFVGGLIILIFKPFKIGDFIETKDFSGTVSEIQIFHTILRTSDNRTIYVPNGALSSGAVTNFSLLPTRRVEWIFGVEYGTPFEQVKEVIEEVLAQETRIQKMPSPFIALKQLDSSSVNILVRVWVKSGDYWGVYFDINKNIYKVFNEKGISFPFPQLTVHYPEKVKSEHLTV